MYSNSPCAKPRGICPTSYLTYLSDRSPDVSVHESRGVKVNWPPLQQRQVLDVAPANPRLSRLTTSRLYSLLKRLAHDWNCSDVFGEIKEKATLSYPAWLAKATKFSALSGKHQICPLHLGIAVHKVTLRPPEMGTAGSKWQISGITMVLTPRSWHMSRSFPLYTANWVETMYLWFSMK